MDIVKSDDSHYKPCSVLHKTDKSLNIIRYIGKKIANLHECALNAKSQVAIEREYALLQVIYEDES